MGFQVSGDYSDVGKRRAEFVPFLQFDPEIRRIVYSTNAIESLNARIRRAVRARGHFPNEQAALNAFTSQSVRSIRRAKAGPGGLCDGNLLSTRSASRSKDESTNVHTYQSNNSCYTVNGTVSPRGEFRRGESKARRFT
jgi:hypothetical protein